MTQQEKILWFRNLTVDEQPNVTPSAVPATTLVPTTVPQSSLSADTSKPTGCVTKRQRRLTKQSVLPWSCDENCVYHETTNGENIDSDDEDDSEERCPQHSGMSYDDGGMSDASDASQPKQEDQRDNRTAHDDAEVECTTTTSHDRQPLRSTRRGYAPREETASAKQQTPWNSAFCCLCGLKEPPLVSSRSNSEQCSMLPCQRCVLSYHVNCLEAFVTHNKTSFPAAQDKDTETRVGWSCPKCQYMFVPEQRPRLHSYRRHRFNFQRWLETADAVLTQHSAPPSHIQGPVVEDQGRLTQSTALVSPSETPFYRATRRKERSGRRETPSDGIKGRVRELMRPSDDAFPFQTGLTRLTESAAARAVEELRRLLKTVSQSKSDHEVFLENGSGVAWLLANLLDHASHTGDPIRDACQALSQTTLTAWYERFDRSHDHDVERETLAMCLLEAISTEKALTPKTGTWKRRLPELDRLVHTEVVTNFLDIHFDKLLENVRGCPNCHAYLREISPLCPECAFIMPFPLVAFQFRQLTNALVWGTLFREVGRTLGPSLPDLLDAMTKHRPWRSLEELGHGDYKLQLYLITHLVFVLSGWGRFRLDPHDLPEEFLFLKASVRVVVALDDCELVGEVLQSLRLFGVTLATTTADESWLQESLLYAVGYLLDRESRHGGVGRLVSHVNSFYDKMHATYCSLLGFLSVRPLNMEAPPKEQRDFIWRFGLSRVAPPVALFLPGETQPRPVVSVDLSSYSDTLAAPAPQGGEDHSSLEFYFPKLYLYRDTHINFARSEKITLLACSPVNFRSDLPVVTVSDPPTHNHHVCYQWSDPACRLRVGVVGTEWVILAQDLAIALRLDKAIFARLISRLVTLPPRAILTNEWPPHSCSSQQQQQQQQPTRNDTTGTPIPCSASACHFKKRIQYPLSLQHVTQNSSDDENVMTLGGAQQSTELWPHDPSVPKRCGLQRALVVTLPNGSKLAVVLSYACMIQLLESVELQLFEETKWVDLRVLRCFIKSAFTATARSDPLRTLALQSDTAATSKDMQDEHHPVTDHKERRTAQRSVNASPNTRRSSHNTPSGIQDDNTLEHGATHALCRAVPADPLETLLETLEMTVDTY